MPSLAIVLSFFTFVSTMAGGLFAVRHRDRLHRILGFTAGVLLGVVAFDILPEVFRLTNSTGADITKPMLALVIAFLLFHIIEKGIILHHAHEGEYEDHRHPQVGVVSALALSGHSFLDGVGIGLGFQISAGVGVAVAIAVIAHDFSDGLNTVSLMLANRNDLKKSVRFLFIDALAPVLGAASTLFFHLPDTWLLIYLGFFAGFLLYIGAADILPEAHSQHSSWTTIGLTVLGTAFMFIVTRFT